MKKNQTNQDYQISQIESQLENINAELEKKRKQVISASDEEVAVELKPSLSDDNTITELNSPHIGTTTAQSESSNAIISNDVIDEDDDDAVDEDDEPGENNNPNNTNLQRELEQLIQSLRTESIDDIVNRFQGSTEEFNDRVNAEIAKIAAKSKLPQNKSITFGKGKLVKNIWMPSYDPLLEFLTLVFPYIPNCKAVKFCHPPHGDEFIPTLQPALIDAAKPYFSQLQSISVEDVDETGWPLLIDAIADNGAELLHLNLEACSEKDPYGSRRGMSTVFPHLSKLKTVRIDGLPLGSLDFPWGGDLDVQTLSKFCPNLTAVSLDFCDISIASFIHLWNSCPNLEFLGVAGLGGFETINATIPELQSRPKLKTLRFVDCQIHDKLVEVACKNAPNLNMFRCVYEYPHSFAHWDPHTCLSDTSLYALSKHCLKLTVLAISRTKAMSALGFSAVLKSCPLRLIDFHSTDWTTGIIGLLEPEFMEEIIPHLTKVSVMNLFDQPNLTEKVFIKLLLSCPQLESLCLNSAKLSPAFLSRIIESPKTQLKRLSIVNCENIKNEDVVWFCEQLVQCSKKFDVLYVSPPTPAKDTASVSEDSTSIYFYPFVTTMDTWFMDEKLDIFSLWSAESSK